MPNPSDGGKLPLSSSSSSSLSLMREKERQEREGQTSEQIASRATLSQQDEIETLLSDIQKLPPELLLLRSSSSLSPSFAVLDEKTLLLFRAFEASQKLSKIYEKKYVEASKNFETLGIHHEMLKREVQSAVISRLDLEDTYELRKSELVKQLKLETQRIDRMWSQKCAQLKKALIKETEHRHLLEQKIEEMQKRSRTSTIMQEEDWSSRSGSVRGSNTYNNHYNSSYYTSHNTNQFSSPNGSIHQQHQHQTPSHGRDSSHANYMGSSEKKTPQQQQPPSSRRTHQSNIKPLTHHADGDDDEEPSAAALYTAADTGVFEPPELQSSESESDNEEDSSSSKHSFKPSRLSYAHDFIPPTDDPAELDKFLFFLLSPSSPFYSFAPASAPAAAAAAASSPSSRSSPSNASSSSSSPAVPMSSSSSCASSSSSCAASSSSSTPPCLASAFASLSTKQNEFIAFCEILDCSNLTRFYIQSVKFVECATREGDMLTQHTKDLAIEIYDTYLRSDAKGCIQLPPVLTHTPSALLAEQKVEAAMFNECQKQARTLLRNDVLPAYITWLRGGMQKPKKNNFTIETESIATTNPVLVMQRWTSRLGLSEVHQKYVKNELDDLLQRHLQEEETLAKLREMERDLDKLNYLLFADLGSGAFGSVYRGGDRRTGEEVAIKVIDLEDVEGDIQTISREVATMKGKKCSQMTEYIDSAIYGTKLWIMMEYMDGGSLLDRISVWGSLKEKHIAIIAREILYGLQFLSNENKIHRDIKAGNILMRKSGAVKLADFGTSRDLSDTFAQCNTQTGSPCWMAPEVINSTTSYDGKVDIWSLGITCLEMALGKAPHYDLKTPMQVMRAIVDNPPPELKGDKWTPYFTNFIRKCLVKDPAQRFTIQQLLQTAFVKRAGKIHKLKKLFLAPVVKGKTK